jgi:hypothetical protein
MAVDPCEGADLSDSEGQLVGSHELSSPEIEDTQIAANSSQNC